MKTERFSITHTLPVSPALVSCWASCCLYQQTHTEQIQTSLSTSSRLCSCNKLFINLTRVKVLSLTVTLSKVLADSNDLQVSCLLRHSPEVERSESGCSFNSATWRWGGAGSCTCCSDQEQKEKLTETNIMILWHIDTLHCCLKELFTLHSGC